MGWRGKGSEDSFLLERIFIVFQKKEDNVMSMHEFTSGLHQLCRGSNDVRSHTIDCLCVLAGE